VTWYFKALPKAFRNRLVPIAPAVTAFLEHASARDASLPDAIRAWLRATLGDAPPPDAWDAPLPDHLEVNVVVVDAAGRELGSGRDLKSLRERLGEAAKASFAASGPSFGKRDLKRWDFGDLPETIEIARGGQRLAAYPALVDEKTSVSLVLADTRDEALASTRRGVVRLIRFALKDAFTRYEKGLPGFTQAALMLKPAIPADRLLADLLEAIADRAFVGDDPLPRDAKAFDEQVKRARARLPAVADAAFKLVATIAASYHAVGQKLAQAPGGLGKLAAELRAQRDELVAPGFPAAVPWAQLQHLPRYLEAIARRWAKARERPDREARHGPQVEAWTRRWRERRDRDRSTGRPDPALDDFRWLLEELRVSLFAQELKTPTPVSLKRVEKAWAVLEGR